jgi:hypothetical protein
MGVRKLLPKIEQKCIMGLAISDPFALMMEAARTSETSVDIKLRTRQCIPEDSKLHTELLIQKKKKRRKKAQYTNVIQLAAPTTSHYAIPKPPLYLNDE